MTKILGRLEYATLVHDRILIMTPQLTDSVLIHTDYPELELHASGKVRDVYRLDNEHLLFVATDRISAFDYVLATGIPQDRKSTRLNSSHVSISYAVFCLKKKKTKQHLHNHCITSKLTTSQM